MGNTKLQELTDKLYQQGLEKGRNEADSLVAEAKSKAQKIVADAEAQGIRLIDQTPRKGADDMTIAFLHPKSTQGILTELCEKK